MESAIELKTWMTPGDSKPALPDNLRGAWIKACSYILRLWAKGVGNRTSLKESLGRMDTYDWNSVEE